MTDLEIVELGAKYVHEVGLVLIGVGLGMILYGLWLCVEKEFSR